MFFLLLSSIFSRHFLIFSLFQFLRKKNVSKCKTEHADIFSFKAFSIVIAFRILENDTRQINDMVITYLILFLWKKVLPRPELPSRSNESIKSKVCWIIKIMMMMLSDNVWWWWWRIKLLIII